MSAFTNTLYLVRLRRYRTHSSHNTASYAQLQPVGCSRAASIDTRKPPDSSLCRVGPPPTRLWPSSRNLAKVGWAAALRAGRMPGKRPSRWPGAWQTAISLAGCLANGHLASPPWPNAWQTAISRGARIRERSPPREAVLTPFVCAMAQCPANGHLVRAQTPPRRRREMAVCQAPGQRDGHLPGIRPALRAAAHPTLAKF